ncbi:MAG TPA: hypothetical protein VHX19_09325 [Stellaceae bacterium]|nr:hypothetical protein [Stellaceae bacterium]
MLGRIVSVVAMAALLVTFPLSSQAQMFGPTRNTTIQIEYREPMPADGDMGALRTKIYVEVQKDCDAAAKAFQEHCAVNSINFNDIVQMNGQPPQGVIAHAQLSLTPETKPGNTAAPNQSQN